MIDIRTGKNIKDYPILEDPKLYVYIMLNDAGKIKIGKTKNIQQRYQSLCGSNSAGDSIVKVCVSPSTYIYNIETDIYILIDRRSIDDHLNNYVSTYVSTSYPLSKPKQTAYERESRTPYRGMNW